VKYSVEQDPGGQSPVQVIVITEISSAVGDKWRMQPTCERSDVSALFQTYRDRIYQYILHMVRDATEAEDLTQETFLRAHRRLYLLRHPEAVGSWLYRIATHVCLDRLRQRKLQDSIDDPEVARHVQSAVRTRPSPAEIAERRQTTLCVQRCLDYLPDRYRVVILLYQIHSLTAPEIAGLLGVKLSTVKMRLHRARRMLQQIMEYGCDVLDDRQGVPACRPRSRITL
jgi:RNA polymerase sigma-70 factor, ECF subfamily